MKFNSKWLLLTIVLIQMSCSFDYDLKTINQESNRLIINGYLNPDSTIRIKVYSTQLKENRYLIQEVSKFNVSFFENETLLYKGEWANTVFTMNYYPRRGAQYSIEISKDQFPAAKATTTVPNSIECTALLKTVRGTYNESQNLVVLSSFIIPSLTSASNWITCYLLRDNGKSFQFKNLYSSNALVDKTNSVGGMPLLNQWVGSTYYSGFIRINDKNIRQISELFFTPENEYTGNDINQVQEGNSTAIQIKLISASPEYDRYNKTLYQQKNIVFDEGDLSSIFYQPQIVYSNVENGLGIFAGVSEINYLLPLPTR